MWNNYRNRCIQICWSTPHTTICSSACTYNTYNPTICNCYHSSTIAKWPKWHMYKIYTLFKAHKNEHEGSSHAKVTYPSIFGSSSHPPIHLHLSSTSRPRLQKRQHSQNLHPNIQGTAIFNSTTLHPNSNHLCWINLPREAQICTPSSLSQCYLHWAQPSRTVGT